MDKTSKQTNMLLECATTSKPIESATASFTVGHPEMICFTFKAEKDFLPKSCTRSRFYYATHVSCVQIQ